MSTVKFDKLNQSTIGAGVANALRDRILDGLLPAGAQLREAHIATEMGVSRAPVREALSRLAEEGLVVKIPYRGNFVTTVQPETITEITRLREVLEPYALEVAAPALTGEGGRLLREATEKLVAIAAGGSNWSAAVDAHLAIHRLIYELTGNRTLAEIWAGWEAQLRIYLAVEHQMFPSLADMAEPHMRLLQVIEQGDMETAKAQILAEHVREPARAFLELAHSSAAAEEPTPDDDEGALS